MLLRFKIIIIVSRQFEVSHHALLGKSQAPRIKEARYLAMYLIHNLTGLKLPDIATFFNCHPAHVLIGLQFIQNKIATNKPTANLIRSLNEKIYE